MKPPSWNRARSPHSPCGLRACLRVVALLAALLLAWEGAWGQAVQVQNPPVQNPPGWSWQDVSGSSLRQIGMNGRALAAAGSAARAAASTPTGK